MGSEEGSNGYLFMFFFFFNNRGCHGQLACSSNYPQELKVKGKVKPPLSLRVLQLLG